MRPDIAQAALQFLQRCQINPQEITTFLTVQQTLSEIASAPAPVASEVSNQEKEDAPSSKHSNHAVG